METYIENFCNFNKSIVYDFDICYGGIGDCIKFFLFLLEICIENNIKLFYKRNYIALEKYLKLNNAKFYISNEEMVQTYNLQSKFDVSNIKEPNIYYIVKPTTLYQSFNFTYLKTKASKVFTFSPEVLKRADDLLLDKIKEYTSIHLRLGDKHLETDASYVCCKDDERKFSIASLRKYITENKSKRLVFFCDNNSFKNKIKEEYPHVIITNSFIGHTSLKNTTDAQTLDSITEFYLLIKSEEIVCASYSGFSLVAALFTEKTVIPL